MKVLFTFGGMPHYLVSLLNRIQLQGKIDVVVVIPEAGHKTIGKGVKQELSGIDFKIIYAQEYDTYYGKQFFKSFRNILKHEKPDIIVTCWPYIFGFIFYPSLLATIKWRKIKLAMKEIPFNVPYKGEAISYYKKHPVYNEEMVYEKTTGIKFYATVISLDILRRLFYKLLDATFIYTEEGRSVEASYGVKPENIYVTYNSPDTDALLLAKQEIANEPKLLKPSNYRLLHVGRLVKWKRVDMLIRSFAKVKTRYKEAELVIIGNGPEEKELKQLVQSLNVDKSVIFAGGIYDNKTLGKYYSESTIYVLAGMGGLSINEAMAFGKPVICSVCDGTEKHLVIEGENGLYFNDAQEGDLTQKIMNLLENQELIEKMGKRSEQRILNDINIHTLVQKYIEGFRRLGTKF